MISLLSVTALVGAVTAQSSWTNWNGAVSSSLGASSVPLAVSSSPAQSAPSAPAGAASSASSQPSSTYSSDGATFTNPILQKYGADPWVVKNGDYYYMTYTTNDNVTILRSSVLTYVKLPFDSDPSLPL